MLIVNVKDEIVKNNRLRQDISRLIYSRCLFARGNHGNLVLNQYDVADTETWLTTHELQVNRSAF